MESSAQPTAAAANSTDSLVDGSPLIDKKIKNFSARLKARAKAEAAKSEHMNGSRPDLTTPIPRPDSSASTVRPDSVLSFRSELPNVKQSDFGVFRPESASILPPETVTTVRPDSVAAIHGAGQGVFRPFQPPQGPTARFNIQYQPVGENDWEARDEMRQRELEEIRARATQMEKTMRWWSDCTANWREKWSKVRNERNKSRDDCRQLRSKLEIVVKECTSLKREKQELVIELDKLRSEIELHSIKDPDKDSDSMSTGSSVSIKSQNDDMLPIGDDDSRPLTNAAAATRSTLTASMAEAKLSELTKMFNAEKEEKDGLKCKIDELKAEIAGLHMQLSDVTEEKDNLKQMLETKSQSSHANRSPRAKLEAGQSDEGVMEESNQLVEDLRKQLEEMQVENASEWAARERLSSEKYSLERENKKLRSELEYLQQEVRKRNTGLSSAKDQDIRILNDELANRNKEHIELKQQHSKTRKQLQEAVKELGHSKRRADQYETEVKKLRARIEELKDELLAAENEIDTQTNVVRKLQRTVDDLHETNDNYQAQNAHLQSRLRSTKPADTLHSPVLSTATTLTNQSLSDDEGTEETI